MRAKRCWNRSVIVAVAALALLAGCSISSLVQNSDYIVDTLRRPATVAAARDTFLLRSSRIFYPDALPTDPAELPPLGAAQRREIAELVQHVLGQLNATQQRRQSVLAAVAGPLDPSQAPTRVVVVDQSQAVAAVDSSGHLAINGRVVQGIYRSALLEVLADNKTAVPAAERERAAFRSFAEFRTGIDGMSPLQPLSDLKAFSRGTRGEGALAGLGGMFGGGENADPFDKLLGGMMSGMFGVLGQRLEDMSLSQRSAALEASFLGAVRFLLAHEFAHLVLGHFPLVPQCDAAVARELAADRLATLLGLLAQADRLPPIPLERGSGGSLRINGAQAMTDLAAQPVPSARQFFRLAYQLAGFDSAMLAVADCRYPDAGARLERVDEVEQGGIAWIDIGRTDAALRRADGQAGDAARVQARFEARRDEVFGDAQRRDPAEVRELKTYEPWWRALYAAGAEAR